MKDKVLSEILMLAKGAMQIYNEVGINLLSNLTCILIYNSIALPLADKEDFKIFFKGHEKYKSLLDWHEGKTQDRENEMSTESRRKKTSLFLQHVKNLFYMGSDYSVTL